MRAHPSPNFNDRRGVTHPCMLVFHYTGMPDCRAALERLCDPLSEVSAHYLIDEDGTVYGLVAEDKRAWHAGVSWWCGITDVNSHSIGIELVNPGHEFGYRAFPDAQIEALVGLCGGILERHGIPACNVVGHCDIAPGRKLDPGELFPWQRLAAAGIGLWPEDDGPVTRAGEPSMLQDLGYTLENKQTAIKAFQRRFCPAHISGTLDEPTALVLARVHHTFMDYS